MPTRHYAIITVTLLTETFFFFKKQNCEARRVRKKIISQSHSQTNLMVPFLK